MSSRIGIGDIFAVQMGQDVLGFFQYIARDSTQLNSHVVRVFKERKRRDELAHGEVIARGEIHFHAHVFLSVGIKLKFWSKLSRADVVDGEDVLFRDSTDALETSGNRSPWWICGYAEKGAPAPPAVPFAFDWDGFLEMPGNPVRESSEWVA